MSRDISDIHEAIASLKNPHTRLYEFIIKLNQNFGIEVSPEDIPEYALQDLEVSKHEVLNNTEFLINENVPRDIIADILWYCPYIMMGSISELENTLIKYFGEDYVGEIHSKDISETQDILSEIY